MTVQPVYEAYARAHGRTAAEQSDHDPHMGPFIIWVSQQTRAWRGDGGELTPAEAVEFHAWLRRGEQMALDVAS